MENENIFLKQESKAMLAALWGCVQVPVSARLHVGSDNSFHADVSRFTIIV